MSKTYLDPATDHVICAELAQTTIIDGIEQPDNVRQQEMMYGTVVYVGPDALRTHEGDHVAYGPYAGKYIIFEGFTFRLIRQGEIAMYIRKSQ